MQSFIQSPQIFAIGFSEEALINSVSAQACRFLGYTAQDLLLKPITRILTEDSAFEIPQILELARKQGIWQGEMVFLSQSGNTTGTRCNLLSMQSNGNRPGGFVLISDLNELSGVEIGERSELAEVSARLRAIAHDLNNPLTVVQGYVQLLEANMECPVSIREDIAKIQSGLSWLADIVSGLHGYAVSLGGKKSNGQTATVYPSGQDKANLHL